MQFYLHRIYNKKFRTWKCDRGNRNTNLCNLEVSIFDCISTTGVQVYTSRGFCIACTTIKCFNFIKRALFIFEQTNMIQKECFCGGQYVCVQRNVFCQHIVVIIQPFFSYNYSFPLSNQILLLHFPIHGNWRLAQCFRCRWKVDFYSSWSQAQDESRNAVENTVPSGKGYWLSAYTSARI